ncbi:MAG: YgfZ/GcvT domain-containing protein [Opitutales bacterium]
MLPISDTGCLRVSGPDAHSFLQNQATADLTDLGVGAARYTLFLNVRGKIEGDAWVLRVDETSFELHTLAGDGESRLLARLEPYLIVEEVELAGRPVRHELTADVNAVSSQQLPGDVRSWDPGWPTSPSARLRAFVGVGSGEMPAGDGAAFEAWRIRRGIPRLPADLEGLTPQEAGLVDRAVSFTKGCFLGQEVMAKLRASGRVNRRLVAFSAKGELREAPDGLYAGERPAGEVRSLAEAEGGRHGLALIKQRILDADTPLALGIGGPRVRLSVS